MNIKSLNLTRLAEEHSSLIRHLAAAAGGFVFAGAHIGGERSMLCVGLAAALPSESLTVFLAAGLRFLLMLPHFTDGLIQLCSMLIITVFAAAAARFSVSDSPFFSAALTTGVLLLFSFAVYPTQSPSGSVVIMRAVAAATAGCFAFSLRTLINGCRLTGSAPLTGVSLPLAAFVYTASVSALASVKLFIDLGRVAGCIAVLAAARRYKMSGGAVMGALTAAAMLAGAPSLAVNTMLLATAGLVCGCFTELGLFAVAVSFLVVCAAGLATVGGPDAVTMFIDAAAGTVIFAALPQGAVRQITQRFFGSREASDTVGRTTASRLGFAASSLGEIRRRLSLAASAMDRHASAVPLSQTVFHSLCRGCESCCVCHRSPEGSAAAFDRLEKAAMRYNGLSDEDVRRQLPGCRFPEQVADSFNYAYKAYLDGRAAMLRVSEMRSLVSEQLSVMENVLSDLSGRIGQIRSADRALSERVREYFARQGCAGARACVYQDESGFRHAEVFLPAEFRAEAVRLAVDISDITDCMLDLPVVTVSDKLTRIVFSELPAYEIASADFGASSTESGCSGDTFGLVRASACECFAVLSDGMGTGKRARLDSMFAVSLASRLLTSGVSAVSAVKLINSLLRVKGWDESFATLDIVRFDLCTGAAELVKAGAAPTYLFRDGAVRAFGGEAFPAGILEGCTPDVFSCKLFEGDVLVMTSDGVDGETVRETLRQCGDDLPDAEDLARMIGEAAVSAEGESHRDDITAAVFCVSLREKERGL